MRKEEIGPFGAWALGLLLLIATMIIIRWLIDFVTWTTLDSGWTQAIGSIAALGIAIYVGNMQHRSAMALLQHGDALALSRQL